LFCQGRSLNVKRRKFEWQIGCADMLIWGEYVGVLVGNVGSGFGGSVHKTMCFGLNAGRCWLFGDVGIEGSTFR